MAYPNADGSSGLATAHKTQPVSDGTGPDRRYSGHEHQFLSQGIAPCDVSRSMELSRLIPPRLQPFDTCALRRYCPEGETDFNTGLSALPPLTCARGCVALCIAR